MLENLRKINVKQKFLQIYFLQSDHQGFFKDADIRLIDKTQASDTTRREFNWMKTLKTLHPESLDTESDH